MFLTGCENSNWTLSSFLLPRMILTCLHVIPVNWSCSHVKNNSGAINLNLKRSKTRFFCADYDFTNGFHVWSYGICVIKSTVKNVRHWEEIFSSQQLFLWGDIICVLYNPSACMAFIFLLLLLEVTLNFLLSRKVTY